MSSKGWKKYKLRDVCTKIGSGATPRGGKETYFAEGPFALVRSQNVLDFFFSYDGLAFIDENQANQLSNVEIQERDVLLNITGDSVARVCQIPSTLLPARVNQHVSIIRPDSSKLIAEFLKYFLLNPKFKNYMLGLASAGGTRNALTKGMIEDFEISLPSLATQRRIAAILSALDDKIELNRQTNATLEAIAQAIFKEWFVDFRFPGATGEMKESELGIIPVGWRVGKVEELCAVNKNVITKRDSFNWIDYLEISEVNRGKIGTITRYNYGEEPSRAKRKLKHGDIVLSTVRPNRGSYFLALTPPKTTIVSTGFSVFSPTNVPFSFLYLLLTNSEKLEYYGHVADGAAYPAINPDLIMKMGLVIPESNILKYFHMIAEPVLNKIYQNEQQSATLAQLRDNLLPKLMSGEIET